MSGGRLLAIGYGAIVKQTFATLADNIAAPLELLILYCKPGAEARAREIVAERPSLARELLITSDIVQAIAGKPAFAFEAAGHDALRTAGPKLLENGIDLLVSSVGALAHEMLRKQLDEAAARGGSCCDFIPGAIGGLDILAAAKLAGIESVTYTGRKPPKAWKGTRAETLVDLATISSEYIFFDGDAGTAARDCR